ncbi:MAG: hypothetical protein IJ242_12640 [Clostridia bacterium]|nr:hypothetical protein [Clostridia bacterium]
MSDRRRNTQQKRKREKRRKRLNNLLFALSCFSLIGISAVFSFLFFSKPAPKETEEYVQTSSLPFDKTKPFSVSDLTPAQLVEVREKGRIHLSDGPREISIGDSLDKVLDHYPSSYTEQLNDEQTGEQSDEMQILYCSSYYRNSSGKMTALPPRGLLNVDSGSITITLLAPTSPYPAGTTDDYGKYEHIYCIYTIDPETMTVSSIVIGIDQHR